MTLHSILVLTDFSAPAEHALDRAALLAAAHKATLRIAYFSLQPHPGLVDPSLRLAQRARQLARQHRIAAEPVSRLPASVDDVTRAARGADLLVIGPRRERAWRQFWRGTTAYQWMRACACPVLVVKQPPQAAYGRVLVAVGLHRDATAMLGYAAHFDVAAELELFHAVITLDDARLRSAEASAAAQRAFREEVQRYASTQMAHLTNTLSTRRSRVLSSIGRGDLARQTVVHQEAVQANLVVVGRNRHTPWLDVFMGSVAQRILQWAATDVLVVPHDFRAASAGAAVNRMRSDFGAQRPRVAVRRRAL